MTKGMIKWQMDNYKRFAKEAMKTIGIRINMEDVILLETASGDGRGYFKLWDNGKMSVQYIDYVMFENKNTGEQFQCFYGAKYYNEDTKTLFYVKKYL